MTLVEPGWHEARARAHACVVPLPPAPISAMDGWAVAGDAPWAVIGRVLAGAMWPTPLAPGQAVRIATGAALPAGCDGVLRSEDGHRR